jgi:putative PIN family toxin of toxin-antitoxin system
MKQRIVLDTNVIFSGLQSQKGASHKILRMIPEKSFEIVISVPLVLEYESVLLKHSKQLKLSHAEISDFLNFICSISFHSKIYYLWRPILTDPFDDHILELAIASSSKYIITYNSNDFSPALDFGLKVLTPEDFMQIIGGK